MIDRPAILAQTPHWVVPPYASPLGIPYEDLPDVVRTAIIGVTWDGNDPEALRLIAYGLYAGALSEADVAGLLTGSDEELLTDVQSALVSTSVYGDERLADLTRAVLHDRADGEMRSRDADDGWVVTLLELVAASRPHVLEALLASDGPSHIVLRWLLLGWSHNDQLVRYSDVLMRRPERQFWIAAAAMLSIAARGFIERNEDEPTVPRSPTSEARLVVSGIVLTEIYDSGRRAQLSDEERARWQQFVTNLRMEVAQAVQSAANARTLQGATDADDTTLVALILAIVPTGAVRPLAQYGEQLIRGYFRPLESSDRRAEDDALPYLAPLVMNDLVTIWCDIGADAGFFEGLRERLRCDEFAYAFTYGHYLTDRRRAMVLAAIGAVAGAHLKDTKLLNAAKTLALELRALPECVSPPFDEVTIASLRERTGLELPPE